VTTYTAYLRIYEPVSAFHEPDRSRWAEYAASPGRPRRRDCLLAGHREALRRVIATPQVALPERESEHAYVRRADGITYVCATTAATRALVYTTPMARARRRVARGLFAVRNLLGQRPAGSGDVPGPSRLAAELADVGRWLEDFHPYSLVELDYGGLVHLVSDDALCGDQSVAEVRAAVDGAARGERELALAMYMRARSRWRAFADLEQAN